MVASYRGHHLALGLLIEAGADLGLANNEGERPGDVFSDSLSNEDLRNVAETLKKGKASTKYLDGRCMTHSGCQIE